MLPYEETKGKRIDLGHQIAAAKSKMARRQTPKKPELTHFLCLPLITPASRLQLSASIADFKADVVRPRTTGGFGLSPDAIRPLGSLHLTLGIMSFPNNEGLDKAIDLLQSLKPHDILAQVTTSIATSEELPRSEIVLSLKGLKSMQQPAKATVLYAPPSDPEDSLQGFAEAIAGKFKDAGLLLIEDRPLLLHATIVNTKHVKQDKHTRKKWDRVFVDDTQALLNRYEDRVWAEAMPLDKIAICKMSAKPVLENGVMVDAEYEVVAEVPLKGTT